MAEFVTEVETESSIPELIQTLPTRSTKEMVLEGVYSLAPKSVNTPFLVDGMGKVWIVSESSQNVLSVHQDPETVGTGPLAVDTPALIDGRGDLWRVQERPLGAVTVERVLSESGRPYSPLTAVR
jgi:hypothetical protein